MNKTIQTALIAGVLILMAGGLYYQERLVQTHSSDAEIYQDSLENEQIYSASLKRRNRKLEDRNVELEQENETLLKENTALKGTVKKLSDEIRSLNATIVKQTATISANEAAMAKLRAESDKLVKQVASLMGNKNADQSAIAALDEKRQELDKKVGELFTENATLEEKALEETKELATLTQQYDEKDRILEIIERVKVSFSEITPYKEANKRAKNLKQWMFTTISFQMQAEDMALIKDQNFIVKILDKDSGVIMSPREGGGENDTAGEKFVFTSNPVKTIKYSNYQEKTGKNYVLQVYYMQGDKTYPLRYGSSDISFKKK